MQTAPVRLGDLSVGFIYPIVAALESQGWPTEPLLHRFALDATRLADAGVRLSIPHYMRLGHAAIELSGQAHLGLHMGQHSRLEFLGLAGSCAALAPDVRSALRDLTRFEPLYANNYLGRSSIQETAEGAWICFYSIAPYNDYNRFVVDAVLSGWLAQAEQVANQPLTAAHIQIEYPSPEQSQVFNAHFACPVEFSAPANRVLLSRKTLELPNPRHCPHSWRELQQACHAQLDKHRQPTSLSERVIQLVAPRLRLGEPDLSETARLLGLPPWTLRRRLQLEGQSFRQLVQNTRHSLACSYLRDTRLSLTEIAWQLGFSSSEAFQRAFKRWQEQTPGEYRQQSRSASSDSTLGDP